MYIHSYSGVKIYGVLTQSLQFCQFFVLFGFLKWFMLIVFLYFLGLISYFDPWFWFPVVLLFLPLLLSVDDFRFISSL